MIDDDGHRDRIENTLLPIQVEEPGVEDVVPLCLVRRYLDDPSTEIDHLARTPPTGGWGGFMILLEGDSLAIRLRRLDVKKDAVVVLGQSIAGIGEPQGAEE
ncbi:MAG: hypothetical protein ABGY71_05310 [bacterium]